MLAGRQSGEISERGEGAEVNNILEIKNLKKYFPVRSNKLFSREKTELKAVDGISFSIREGEIFGLVGESGCGKSTLGRTILKLYEPTAGKIFFQGEDITDLNQKQMQKYRRKMQMIFQDPYASLDPRMTIGDIIAEPMVIEGKLPEKERTEQVQMLMETVGLKPDHIRRYPHEFSGGQRQRIGIARALAVNPIFIMCDEPISALDVSIQAQIMNMLEKLREERNLSYLFVAHDLSMVRHISHRIGVMYLGNMMEIGPANDIYHHPLHPYSKALLSAVPIPDPRRAKSQKRIILEGEIPSPVHAPKGCVFCTRCRYSKEKCFEERPVLRKVEEGRLVACHLDLE